MKNFLKKISYHFNNPELLEEALTHPSFSKKDKANNYQRLEFLGDTILALVIAETLIAKYPKANEGELSKRRAYLVCGEVLSKVASQIGVGEVIKLSDGEETIGGRSNKRNLENSLEAIIGAIYLDSNLEECQKFILRNWKNIIDQSEETPRDSVSLLQEIIQSKSKKLPIYNIEKVGGNSHQPIFEAIVNFDDRQYRASGSSKKEAQKNVATIAVENLAVENLAVENLAVENLAVENLAVENLAVENIAVKKLH
ncbi:MAG: ribonuclease-3 [Rickettsiales bacterium]